ncbi:MAG: DNA-directed RNA polymerase subunit alpha C-terminal domain-containing protein [Pseudomonadota bacterium]
MNKLGDLKNYTRADLRNFRHIGKKGIDEIEQCLLQAGIVLT